MKHGIWFFIIQLNHFLQWMAPEVVSESPYTENVDVWSLAVTIIEMMDRVPPLYYLENSQDIYAEILYGEPQRFHFAIPSRGMTALLSWMMTHNGLTRPGAKSVLKVRKNSSKHIGYPRSLILLHLIENSR